ncbi:MAG TPA: class I SAM-dependent methyltransferase [bacterium]|nr:class I SAM-dependent methyltransferase [bacterium]
MGRPFYPGLLKCSSCGHIYADLSLQPSDYHSLYQRGYFFGDEYHDYLSDKRVIQKNFKLRLKVLTRFLERDRHRSLLEIGCAYGFFLELAQQRFERVAGIDICEDGTRYARETLGLDAVGGDFLSLDFSENRYEVVCLWDTIEHLPRPDLIIDKIATATEPGALLALTTGDIGSLNARLSKQRWRLIYPPTHIHYFTSATVGRLLRERGFEIIFDRTCGCYRSIDFVLHMLAREKRLPSILPRVLHRLGWDRWAFYLNLFDIRYYIARRLDPSRRTGDTA